MSNKIKTNNSTLQQIGNASQQVGLLLMTAAVTLGMVEMPEHLNGKIVLPAEAVYSQVGGAGANDETNSTLRREKEESGPHYVSYSSIQRTHARSGKR